MSAATAHRLPALRRAVCAACAARGLDTEARHDLQRALTGKASLTAMSGGELVALLEHLNGRTGTPRAADEWRFVFRLAPERQVYGRKLYRLAQRLGPRLTPPVAVAPKAYVEGIARRMAGCDTVLEFCAPERLRQIVQALEVFLARHGG